MACVLARPCLIKGTLLTKENLARLTSRESPVFRKINTRTPRISPHRSLMGVYQLCYEKSFCSVSVARGANI